MNYTATYVCTGSILLEVKLLYIDLKILQKWNKKNIMLVHISI